MRKTLGRSRSGEQGEAEKGGQKGMAWGRWWCDSWGISCSLLLVSVLELNIND